MMSIALMVILMIISVVIILVSLVMSPDSNGFSGALVGSGDLELFKFSKERGFKKFIKYLMFSLGVLLLILTLVMRAIV
ncbi:preprotein translocase subunit SecG [Mycoplasmopsis equigenitalium]|uniref:Protein-export membrane protein SecG n=1 Tax=Mycoplasmopsis equigenitalium TaxID=114883 RepID=A0ABY5J496_9BACT|nr:preprotein translocase subunit SecG [Mycoplasmopsis equigenitalium]UUD36775.1 preprotein translocase subunit SecG [Mycoplasmopsis equigenitalium]